MQPLRQGMDRAGLIGGAAGHFHLAPAGLAAQSDQGAILQNLDPAARLRCVILAVIKADDLGPAQPSGETDQEDCPVAQPAQVMRQGGQHVAKVFRQDRLFLDRGPRVSAADARQDAGNVAILAVQPLPALRIAPGQSRETALDGRDRKGRGSSLRRGQVGDVETDQRG